MLPFGERGLPRSECFQNAELFLGWSGGVHAAAEASYGQGCWWMGCTQRAGGAGCFIRMLQPTSQCLDPFRWKAFQNGLYTKTTHWAKSAHDFSLLQIFFTACLALWTRPWWQRGDLRSHSSVGAEEEEVTRPGKGPALGWFPNPCIYILIFSGLLPPHPACQSISWSSHCAKWPGSHGSLLFWFTSNMPEAEKPSNRVD